MSVVAQTDTTTALDLIKRAMRLNGVYNIGEEPSADESSDMLEVLNAMLDSWATDSTMVYAESKDAITLTANQTSVSVGPSGDFVTERPIEVLSASNIVIGTTVYPLDLYNLAEYNSIRVPSSAGTPRGIWCSMSMPDIVVTPYPIPSEAMTLNLWSMKQIRNFTALTTLVALPPGYKRALAYNLAVETAPEFEREASPSVQKIAANTLRLIKRGNLRINPLGFSPAIPSYVRGDIFAGE